MNSNVQKDTSRGLLAVALAVAATSLSGCSIPDSAGILIPKPAEFFPALVAFIIIWFVFAKLVWPQILGKLDERQKKIQDDLDAAESARQKSLEIQKGYEQQIAEVTAEAEDIVSKAKQEAEKERAQILDQAQREAADTIARGRAAIDSERHKAMVELSSGVVDLSVQIASKLIKDEQTLQIVDKISDSEFSESQQRELAEKYLMEMEKTDER
jgi:F-type H+-transporting ATPase subunit b